MRTLLCLIAGVSLFLVMPAAAKDLTAIIKAGTGIAAGEGTKVEARSDGSWAASDGHKHVVCKHDQIAIASTQFTTIETVRGETMYPYGLVACYNLSDFGGTAYSSRADGELLLRPNNVSY